MTIIIFSRNRDSKINIHETDKIEIKTKYGLIGIVLGVITLIVTVIIGKENIVNFFIK